jgi:hypothetical protein
MVIKIFTKKNRHNTRRLSVGGHIGRGYSRIDPAWIDVVDRSHISIPQVAMRENLCTTKLPPEAMREYPLHYKFTAEVKA